MQNNIIELENEAGIIEITINKKDNNIDGLDNLDSIPEIPAVYAICGRVNGIVANCRFVGTSENLRATVTRHFGDDETYGCLKTFMQSIKVKVLLYQQIDSSAAEGKLAEWKANLRPECNDALNKIH